MGGGGAGRLPLIINSLCGLFAVAPPPSFSLSWTPARSSGSTVACGGGGALRRCLFLWDGDGDELVSRVPGGEVVSIGTGEGLEKVDTLVSMMLGDLVRSFDSDPLTTDCL